MFEIQQRDVPAQWVLTERYQHVRQIHLPEVNRESMGRLAKVAEDQGGVSGPILAIFFNAEYDENDIDFEVCVPVAAAPNPPAEQARVEPAHREAYVRLRKWETAPPRIGEAYGAVVAWIAAHGLSIAGPPREVYFTDFDTAGPNDEVFDVAFPIA